MDNYSTANGNNSDGIEFRTIFILSFAHITEENSQGNLGQETPFDNLWPVRFVGHSQMGVYVSEDGTNDENLPDHLKRIFDYAREKGVRELMFDSDVEPSDLFDYGGDANGFLDPQNPEHRAVQGNQPKG
mgnify:FL=1